MTSYFCGTPRTPNFGQIGQLKWLNRLISLRRIQKKYKNGRFWLEKQVNSNNLHFPSKVKPSFPGIGDQFGSTSINFHLPDCTLQMWLKRVYRNTEKLSRVKINNFSLQKNATCTSAKKPKTQHPPTRSLCVCVEPIYIYIYMRVCMCVCVCVGVCVSMYVYVCECECVALVF